MAAKSVKQSFVITLMACRIATEQLEKYIDELKQFADDWIPDYTTTFIDKIDDCLLNDLGLDKLKQLKDATISMNEVQKTIKKDISIFKTITTTRLTSEADTILSQLGYEATLANIHSNSQKEMIEFLKNFAKNIQNEALRNKLIDAKIAATFIDRIANYHNAFVLLEAKQEIEKGDKKIKTKEINNKILSIKNETQGFCDVAQTFFSDKPEIQQLFVFSKIVANMKGGNSTKQEEEENDNAETTDKTEI